VTALTLAAAVFLWARRIDARPADPLKPRLAPWRTIQIVAGIIGFMALLVLLQLFQAGAPQTRY